jgi:hypothetical protein
MQFPQSMSEQAIKALYETLMQSFVHFLNECDFIKNKTEEQRRILTSYVPSSKSNVPIRAILEGLLRSDLDKLFIFDVDKEAYSVEYSSCSRSTVCLSPSILYSIQESWESKLKEEDLANTVKKAPVKETCVNTYPMVVKPGKYQESSYWYRFTGFVSIDTMMGEGLILEIVRLSKLQEKDISPTQQYGYSAFQFEEYIDFTNDKEEAKITSPLDSIKQTVENPCLTIGSDVLFRLRCKDKGAYGALSATDIQTSKRFPPTDYVECLSSLSSFKYFWQDWQPQTLLDKWIGVILSDIQVSVDTPTPKRHRETCSSLVGEDIPVIKQGRRSSYIDEEEGEKWCDARDWFPMRTPCPSFFEGRERRNNETEKEQTVQPTLIGWTPPYFSSPTSISDAPGTSSTIVMPTVTQLEHIGEGVYWNHQPQFDADEKQALENGNNETESDSDEEENRLCPIFGTAMV